MTIIPNPLDLTKMTFGKLTVLSKAPNKGKKTYWTCQCECGNIKDIQTGHLRNGSIQSCGCFNKFKAKNKDKSKPVIDYRRRIKIALCSANENRCSVCGVEDDIIIYDFHHLDPTSKSFGIGSASTTRSKRAYANEAKKCVMVCANCHRKIEKNLISQDNLQVIFDEKIYFQTLDKLVLDKVEIS